MHRNLPRQTILGQPFDEPVVSEYDPDALPMAAAKKIFWASLQKMRRAKPKPKRLVQYNDVVATN